MVGLLQCQTPRLLVERHVHGCLTSGAWKVGGRIPQETEIATALRVSRGTVRAALKAFDEAGIFEARKGSGRIVRRTPADSRSILARTVVFARSSGPMVADNELLIERRLMDAAASRGLLVLAVDLLSVDAHAVAHLAEARPAGVVVAHCISQVLDRSAKLRPFVDAGIPIVVQGDYPWLANFDRVVGDQATGARMLVEHFVSLGLRRIAQVTCIDNPDHYWFKARRSGYEAAMADAGLATLYRRMNIRHGLDHQCDSIEAFQLGARAMAGWFIDLLTGPDRVQAILLDTDLQTFYAAAAVRLAGLEPGRDVLLAGYDNYWATSPLRMFESTPLVATIDKQQEQFGDAMLKLLDARIAGDMGPPTQQRLEPKLVETAKKKTEQFSPA